MNKARDIFIFGHNSILAKNFIKSKDSAHNLVTLSREKNCSSDIKCNLGNLMNLEDLNHICSKINEFNKFDEKIFILFSWSGRPRLSISDKNTWSINSNILINFLEICKRNLPSKIIFISSTTVYSEKCNYSFNESELPSPDSEYGKQKLIAEYILENYAKANNIKITILRVSSAYGYDSRFSDQGVINKWLYDAINFKNLNLYNSIESKINFISFDQISNAINSSIDKKISGTYNIASIQSVYLKEILNKIKLLLNIDLNLEIKDNTIRTINIDISKFYKETNIIFENNVINNIESIYYQIKSQLN